MTSAAALRILISSTSRVLVCRALSLMGGCVKNVVKGQFSKMKSVKNAQLASNNHKKDKLCAWSATQDGIRMKMVNKFALSAMREHTVVLKHKHAISVSQERTHWITQLSARHARWVSSNLMLTNQVAKIVVEGNINSKSAK